MSAFHNSILHDGVFFMGCRFVLMFMCAILMCMCAVLVFMCAVMSHGVLFTVLSFFIFIYLFIYLFFIFFFKWRAVAGFACKFVCC
jgi:hypothetical protein